MAIMRSCTVPSEQARFFEELLCLETTLERASLVFFNFYFFFDYLYTPTSVPWSSDVTFSDLLVRRVALLPLTRGGERRISIEVLVLLKCSEQN